MPDRTPPPVPRPLPRLTKAGLGVMGFGFLFDLAEHGFVSHANDLVVGGFPLAEHAAHLVVLVGMLAVIAGIVVDGIRDQPWPDGPARKEPIDVPIGDFVNGIPPIGFLAIHIVLFLFGAYAASRSFRRGRDPCFGTAFSLFALAEISYMTYHLDWTTFLFAHTISEVLDLAAFVSVFACALPRPSSIAAGSGPAAERGGRRAEPGREAASPGPVRPS